jgi:proton-translocating NADH-quinone oxidoreductase chain M
MFIAVSFLILSITLVLLFFIPFKNKFLLKTISALTSSLLMLLSVSSLLFFQPNNDNFTFFYKLNFFTNFFNIKFLFALDGISIFFYILTSLLITLCIFFVWEENLIKEYFITLFSIHLILLIIFSTLNLFLFYIFFEALLIPMYVLIGFWGSRERKVRAAYLLFFYTVLGSILFLSSILYIYSTTGTFNYETLLQYNFSFKEQIFLWVAFFISFASKIPMFPFHIWLPEAHVEAPTVGSVLLAGILLKLGVYGLIRYNLVFFPAASHFFTPLIYVFALISIIAASLNAIRQTDLKRIIAYSSIAHMNIVVIGIFSFNIIGLSGALVQSVSHGFVSGALFFLIGIIYSKYHTRYIYYYSGLMQLIPLYSIFFLFFTLANIAFPGTSNFIGEFVILLGVYKNNKVCSTISAVSVVLSGAYSLWVYNRFAFGNLKSQFLLKYTDLNLNEFLILFYLAIPVIYLGVFPTILFDLIYLSCSTVCIVY